MGKNIDLLQIQWLSRQEIDLIPAEDRKKFPRTFTDTHPFSDRHSLFVARKNGHMVGVATIYEAPQNLNIDYLEIQQEMRHNGIATSMLTYLFDTAVAKQKMLTSDGFTSEGRYLTHIIDKLCERHPGVYQTVGRA